MANNTYIIVGVVVLVLLIVIGGGVWWYFKNKKDIKVEIKPRTTTVTNGKTAKFATGTIKVTWSVNDSALGDIDADGLFTAKGSSGKVTITAVSIDDKTKKDTATVNLNDGSTGTLTITPTNATVPDRGTQKFTATIPVDWSVDNVSLGSIDNVGLFTAKSGSGIVAVTAVSKTDSTKKSAATVKLSPYSGPSDATCVGGDFKRCVNLGPTKSDDDYTPFEMMCANGEYIDSLSASWQKATHAIGAKCSGVGGEQWFGSRANSRDDVAEKILWVNGKAPEGGYKGIEAWRHKDTDSVGVISIFNKNGNKVDIGRQTDLPQRKFDCGDKGVITGIYGTSKGDIINTIGIRCSYKD